MCILFSAIFSAICNGAVCVLWAIRDSFKACTCTLEVLEKICTCLTSCCKSSSHKGTTSFFDTYDIDWETVQLKDPGQHVVLNIEEYDM